MEGYFFVINILSISVSIYIIKFNKVMCVSWNIGKVIIFGNSNIIVFKKI